MEITTQTRTPTLSVTPLAETLAGTKTLVNRAVIQDTMPALTGAQSVAQWLKPLLQLHITNANTYTRAVQYAHGVTATTDGYAGGVYSPTQNRIYLVPFARANISTWHYIDCAKGTVVAYTHGVTAVANAYKGGVYSPTQNRIYFVPYAQGAPANNNWHYVDCATGVVTAYAHGLTNKAVANAYVGGVFSPIQNRIYFVPYAQSVDDYWHYIDCATGTATAYTHSLGADKPVTGGYSGGVYSPTLDRIYFAPQAQGDSATYSKWHYIDCATSGPTITAYTHGATSVAGAYAGGGIYSPTQDRIYFTPSVQAAELNWHYIDSAGTVVAYAHGLATPPISGAYYGAVYSPSQNRIYFIPSTQGDQGTWHYLDCATGLVVPYTSGVTVGAGAAYSGGTFNPSQNRIYFVPTAQANPTYTTWHYLQCTSQFNRVNPHQFGSTIITGF